MDGYLTTCHRMPSPIGRDGDSGTRISARKTSRHALCYCAQFRTGRTALHCRIYNQARANDCRGSGRSQSEGGNSFDNNQAQIGPLHISQTGTCAHGKLPYMARDSTDSRGMQGTIRNAHAR
jgi:hypothetical protein